MTWSASDRYERGKPGQIGRFIFSAKGAASAFKALLASRRPSQQLRKTVAK